jgi:hypothetical protein
MNFVQSILIALLTAIVSARNDGASNSQLVAHLRESVTAISGQLAVIAETLQHLPAETREHENLMKTLLQLRDEHESLKRRLQESTDSTSRKSGLIGFLIKEHSWKVFLVLDALLGAVVYEQHVRPASVQESLKGEALWIRRIVTGTCVAVFVLVLHTLINLLTNNSPAVESVTTITLLTIRALLLTSALLNDLMRLPRALQAQHPPPPPSTAIDGKASSALDQVRERTARKLETSTMSSSKR